MARAKEFDPDKALDDAMHLFWDKGYFDTSIRDLIERTGVNYYGLYEVFDSKHGMYVAALGRYRRLIGARVIAELSGPGTPMQAIRRAFAALVAFLRESDEHDGCMMCGAMIELAPHDKEIAKIVTASRKDIAKAFRAALERGDTRGHDIKAEAEFLTTAVFSVGLLLRTGASAAEVDRYVETTINAVR